MSWKRDGGVPVVTYPYGVCNKGSSPDLELGRIKMAFQGDSSQALCHFQKDPVTTATRPARYVQGRFQAESRESPIASVLDEGSCSLNFAQWIQGSTTYHGLRLGW